MYGQRQSDDPFGGAAGLDSSWFPAVVIGSESRAMLLDGFNMTLIFSHRFDTFVTQLKPTETEKRKSSLPRRNNEDLKRSPGGQL